jgi:periplasmic protein TonB
MTVRYAAAAASAAVVTFALFFVMQSLIAGQSANIRKNDKRFGLDFVRLKREETVQRKNRERPKQIERSESVPRVATVKDQPSAPHMKVVKVDAPKFNPSLALAGEPTTLSAGADTDVVPLVRVDARYPSRAQARGIEGWVYLRFTVTPQGTTTDIEVLDSDPKGTFEDAAVSAVKKYKYKPRVESGVPVVRPGMEVVLSFEIED